MAAREPASQGGGARVRPRPQSHVVTQEPASRGGRAKDPPQVRSHMAVWESTSCGGGAKGVTTGIEPRANATVCLSGRRSQGGHHEHGVMW
jgi:hypothetical protein